MWKKSRWDMMSKTMKCVTAMTYRWTLGWWKSPCGVLGHFFKKGVYQLEGVSWLG